jgi:CBS domain-containing protein
MNTLELPFVGGGVTIGDAVDLLKEHQVSALVVGRPAGGAALVTAEQIVAASKEGARILDDLPVDLLHQPIHFGVGSRARVVLPNHLIAAFSTGPDICKCTSGDESHVGLCGGPCSFDDGVYSL